MLFRRVRRAETNDPTSCAEIEQNQYLNRMTPIIFVSGLTLNKAFRSGFWGLWFLFWWKERDWELRESWELLKRVAKEKRKQRSLQERC